jgi:phage shock protein PspC (stress-responsive transcriptional regulator)/predicted membrane protein
VLGGVAGGLADYLDIDPVLIRVAFVVLALVSGGVGIPVYIVAWIVMPEEPAGGAPGALGGAHPPAHHDQRGPLTAGLLFGLLLMLVGAVWLLRELDIADVNLGAALAVVLIAVGALLVVTLGSVARGGLITLGVLLTVVLAAGVSVDIPFDADGAFGDRVERPRTVADLEDEYSHAFGSFTLDLSEVDFPRGTKRVEVSTAFGSMQLIVPREVGVRVEAHVSFGSIDALGEELNAGPVGNDRTIRSADYDRADRKLDLKVDSAFGSVEVIQR